MSSRSLLSTITFRAMNTYTSPTPKELGSEDWEKWYQHWLNVAENFYQELINESLMLSAAKVRTEIDLQKQFHDHGIFLK